MASSNNTSNLTKLPPPNEHKRNFQDTKYIFHCERLRVRPLEYADLEIFASNRSVPSIAQYQGWDTPYTLEQAKELLAKQENITFGENGTWFQLAVEIIETGEYVGDLVVHFIDDDQAEIGFTLVLEHQHKGYGREAVRKLIAYLCKSKSMGKRRITATTDVLNDSCVALLTAVGMRKEGHFIENIFFKGAWGSEYSFAILASEVVMGAVEGETHLSWFD